MAEPDWEDIVRELIGDFTLDVLPPSVELPALPHAATIFVQKANDESVSNEELAAIIETDAGLTTELLRYVNSSFMGLRNRAKTVQHTLSLLGRKQARMHIVTTATRAAVQARKSRLVNHGTFWSSSLQKALFSKEVAKLLKADADLAFAGALLQDFLVPLLSNELYDDYLEFISNRDEMPNTLYEYEQKRYGWDHALSAAALAARWHLPADLTCCILFHHAGLKILGDPRLGRTAVAAVALSAMLPDEIRQQRYGLEQLARLGQKWKAFDLEQIAAKVDADHEAIGLGVQNPYPLVRLCQPILSAAAN